MCCLTVAIRGKKLSFLVFSFVYLLFILTSTTQADDQAEKVSAPGGSSGNSIGSGRALPDLITGTMSYSIPIEVAPGRRGLQPNIALVYRSGNPNGLAGVGWMLEFGGGAIERRTKFGVDYSTSSKDYVLKMAGSSSDLVVFNSNNNEYRVKFEDAFNRIVNKPATQGGGKTYWEVTDKKGTLFLFGQADSSRKDAPPTCPVGMYCKPSGGSPTIFGWYLDEVVDPNGNSMSISYDLGEGQIYPVQISYNGNSFVKFYFEDRNDISDIYPGNLAVRTSKRLKTIEVIGGGYRMRVYRFNYSYSPGTGQSMLSSVEQFGKDASLDASGNVLNAPETAAVPKASRLPPVTFTYTSDQLGGLVTGTNGPSVTVRNMNLTGGNSADTIKLDVSRIRVGDFNGDGRRDLARIEGWGESAVPIKIYLANSSNGFDLPFDGPLHTVRADLQAGNIGIGRIMLGDFNGDGRTDIAQFPAEGTTGPVKIFISNGTTFSASFDGPTVTLGNNEDAFVDLARIRLGDFDGDGKTDIARIEGWGSPAAPISIYLSNGNSFTGAKAGPSYAITANVSTAMIELSRILLGDFNGDGRTDIAQVTSNGTPEAIKIFLSKKGPDATTPLVFTQIDGPTITIRSTDMTTDLSRIKLGDFNGDGKTDIAIVQGWGEGATPMDIYLSAGEGFSPVMQGPSFVVPSRATQAAQIGTARIILGDFNGDGKTDIAEAPREGFTEATNLYLSNGNGSAQSVHFTGPFPGPTVSISSNDYALADLSRFREGDFNGDGKVDLARVEGAGDTPVPMSMYYSNGQPPDFLKTVSNGLRAITTVSYSSSAGAALNPLLPFPVWHISSVLTDDGFGITSTTNYLFSGGYYHIPERDFRGFNFVQVTGPVTDGKQSITKTWFHQGNDTAVDQNIPKVDHGYTKGKPYRVEVSDQAGVLLSKVETTYLAKSTAPYSFHPPGSITTSTCNGGCSKTTRITFDYDDRGNVITEDNEGDTSDPTDDKTVTRAFTSNQDLWIVGLPLRETIYRGRSTATQDRAAETTFFYDGAANCGVRSTNTNPTKGNLTRIERLLDGGANPETRMAYDAYGNLSCTRDPNGNITTISFDSSSTFPTATISPTVNGVQLQTTTKYYGVGAEPADNGLYGQVKSVTGPNGNTATTLYDSLGRVTRTISPDGGSQYLYYNDLGLNTQHVKTVTTTTASDSLSSWTYFDGFGRTILEKKSGSIGKVIATKQEYNLNGTVKRSSLPYFDGIDTPKWKTFTYDALGRVIQTVNPDGSTTSASYIPWVVTGIDASGHQKRETRDGFGRLKKVEEFTGAAPAATLYATTNYAYDVLGNLTSVDVQGVKTTMRYDTLGRKIAMSDPDTGSCGDLSVQTFIPNPSFPWYPTPCWNYLYDANGHLIKQIDAQGTQLVFTYDALNRVTTKSFTDLAPPAAPSGPTATAISASQINLSWSAASDNIGVKEYRIERCNNRPGTTACSNFIQITSVVTTSYSDTGRTDGMNYTYRIRAMDTSGNLGTYSSTATATTPDITPPTSPTGLTATAFASNRIDLSWTASTDNVGVTAYEVQRCQGTGCTPTFIATVTGTSYNDTQRTANTTYTYRVRATDAAGNLGSFSSPINGSTPAAGADTTLPTVPATLTATAVSPTQINLTWTASTDNLLLSYYEVERSTNINGPYTLLAAPVGTTFTDNTATAGITYLYRVRAVDGAGNKSGNRLDLATTILFTDDPLVAAVTAIKATHITQLRQAVNAVRTSAGLAAAAWTDATLTGVPVKAAHIQELRTNLNQALTTLGLPVPSYTDATLASFVTVIKSVHVGEPRQGVK